MYGHVIVKSLIKIIIKVCCLLLIVEFNKATLNIGVDTIQFNKAMLSKHTIDLCKQKKK